MEINFDLYEHQDEFIFSDKRHTALIGGYGSGKSHGGVVKTVIKKLELGAKIPCAYYLPTYGLIKDVAYPKFKEVFEEKGIPYSLNKSDHDFTTPYGIIHLRSMNNPDNIVGYETGYALIDETDILPLKKMDEVFARILARNRRKLPDGMENCTDVVGTPEGYKWAYKFFVKELTENRSIIKADTRSNTTLSETYVQTLMDVYTDEQLLAYLSGEFVNLTSGSVYKYFNRKRHETKRTVQDKDVLHVGMDFNITKMHSVINVVEGDTSHAVDELVNVYDTFEMVEKLQERYGDHEIIVYPDASGKNRKSSSKKSDHDIIRDAGFKIRSSSTNPFVSDRVNSMNKGFREMKQLVNTEKCPTLTEALENLAYDKNGDPDKSSGYDHITEAQGYFVYANDKKKLIKGKSSYRGR